MVYLCRWVYGDVYKVYQFHEAADVPRPASVDSGDQARNFLPRFFHPGQFIGYRCDERQNDERRNSTDPTTTARRRSAHLRAPTHGMPPRTAAEPRRNRKKPQKGQTTKQNERPTDHMTPQRKAAPLYALLRIIQNFSFAANSTVPLCAQAGTARATEQDSAETATPTRRGAGTYKIAPGEVETPADLITL